MSEIRILKRAPSYFGIASTFRKYQPSSQFPRPESSPTLPSRKTLEAIRCGWPISEILVCIPSGGHDGLENSDEREKRTSKHQQTRDEKVEKRKERTVFPVLKIFGPSFQEMVCVEFSGFKWDMVKFPTVGRGYAWDIWYCYSMRR